MHRVDVDEGLPDYFVWSSVCNEVYSLSGSPFSDLDLAYGAAELTFTVEGSGVCAAGGVPAGQALETAQLLPNFPNPFNPVTTIQFGVPETMSVRLVVYDMTGREVKRLVDDVLPEGYYDVTFEAGSLSSGNVYVSIRNLGLRSTSSDDVTQISRIVICFVSG